MKIDGDGRPAHMQQLALGIRNMSGKIGHRTASRLARLTSGSLSAVAAAILSLGIPFAGHAQRDRSAPPPPPAHIQMARPAQQQQRPNVQARPGQQHLPEWMHNHQNMTPQQREDALRREPGFNHLPPEQQQRLIGRMHSLEEKSPQQQQRILGRSEAFERLSPERRQEVRGASQALSQMSPDRRRVVGRAFNDLRHMPPGQRLQVLNSARFAGQFSPQERTVLGNLLSIEPYQPREQAMPQPYFGR
jgi:hypothetical protein